MVGSGVGGGHGLVSLCPGRERPPLEEDPVPDGVGSVELDGDSSCGEEAFGGIRVGGRCAGACVGEGALLGDDGRGHDLGEAGD
ncbi:MAG: hypothetical protein ACYCTL_04950 [Acidimicrobiales bacterium]